MMTFEEWLDLKIEQELEKNSELRKVFEEHPERKEMYKQKLIDSESNIDGSFHMQYKEEMQKECFSNG